MKLIKKIKGTRKKLVKQSNKRFSKLTKRFKRHKHHRKIILTICVVVGIILGAVFYIIISRQPDGRLVTFHDRGESHVIFTKATTVKNALKDARIAVDAKDSVEPSIDSELLSTDSAVIINRARPVLVVDGSFRERVLTAAQSPNEIALAVGISEISQQDKSTLSDGNFVTDGASTILTIERANPAPVPSKLAFAPTAQTLTRSKGAQIFVDSNGVAHRETYYDLPMNIVITHCGPGDYTIRADGAKIDKDGYVLVAAGYRAYPRCSIVETSMGPGKVYDTGGFALRYPHGFDLATDWTNYDGR